MILRKFTLNNALDTLQSAIDLYGESIRLYPRFKGTYAAGIRRWATFRRGSSLFREIDNGSRVVRGAVYRRRNRNAGAGFHRRLPKKGTK